MNFRKVFRIRRSVEKAEKPLHLGLFAFANAANRKEKVKLLFDALKYKYAPFVRKKSVVNKYELLKTDAVDLPEFSSG